MLDLSTLVDYDTFKSVSTKESDYVKPYGKDIFQVKLLPGFYAHLLALGPEEGTNILSEKIVHTIDSDNVEIGAHTSDEIYAPYGNPTPFNKSVHKKGWSTDKFTVLHPWTREAWPVYPERATTKKYQNLPARITISLPAVRTRKKLINDVYGIENIRRKRYVISPRSLAFFLEFGLVAHPVPYGVYEDSKYDINPYNMVLGHYGQTKKPEMIYDADLGKYVELGE